MNSLYRAAYLTAIFWTTVSMSAYTPHETGSRTTASGAKAKEGYTCAANFVPIGSVIIYDGHKYVVQDRMNPKYNRHVDLFMESHKKAIQFGRKEAKVQVITQGDVKAKYSDKREAKKQQNNKPKKVSPVKADKTAVKQSLPETETRSNTANPIHVSQAGSHKPEAPSVLKPQARP